MYKEVFTTIKQNTTYDTNVTTHAQISMMHLMCNSHFFNGIKGDDQKSLLLDEKNYGVRKIVQRLSHLF